MSMSNILLVQPYVHIKKHWGFHQCLYAELSLSPRRNTVMSPQSRKKTNLAKCLDSSSCLELYFQIYFIITSMHIDIYIFIL